MHCVHLGILYSISLLTRHENCFYSLSSPFSTTMHNTSRKMRAVLGQEVLNPRLLQYLVNWRGKYPLKIRDVASFRTLSTASCACYQCGPWVDHSLHLLLPFSPSQLWPQRIKVFFHPRRVCRLEWNALQWQHFFSWDRTHF